MKKFLLIIALLISASTLWAYNFSAVCESGQTLYYSITSDSEPYTVKVIYKSESNNNYNQDYNIAGDLIIPETVEYNNVTYAVTVIHSHAFDNCAGLTSVTIPNSVTNIGGSAFWGCSGIRRMTVPFVGLNSSATTAGASTHFGSIFGNTSYDGSTQVSTWTNTNGGTVSDSYAYIPSNLRIVTVTGGKIFQEAFRRCSMLVLVTLGDSVTRIGQNAFSGCSNLSSITIGNSVTNVEQQAFSYCSGLTSVYYTGDISQWCKISFNDEQANPLYYAHNLYLENNIVSNLVIPNTVTEIKNYAFYNRHA